MKEIMDINFSQKLFGEKVVRCGQKIRENYNSAHIKYSIYFKGKKIYYQGFMDLKKYPFIIWGIHTPRETFTIKWNRNKCI